MDKRGAPLDLTNENSLGKLTGQEQMTCTDCGATFSITLPKLEIVNSQRFCVAVAVHNPVKCPKCGKAFKFFIDRVETSWSASAITNEERRQIEGTDLIKLM